jgi:hypothetical protein
MALLADDGGPEVLEHLIAVWCCGAPLGLILLIVVGQRLGDWLFSAVERRRDTVQRRGQSPTGSGSDAQSF